MSSSFLAMRNLFDRFQFNVLNLIASEQIKFIKSYKLFFSKQSREIMCLVRIVKV